jgi:hypothetical protein
MLAKNGFFFEKYGAIYSRTQFTDGRLQEAYLSGIPAGALSARPDSALLGEADAGLPYIATDTSELWQWTGVEWVLRLSGGSGSGSDECCCSFLTDGESEFIFLDGQPVTVCDLER